VAAAPDAAVARAPLVPPTLRLPDTVRPTRYAAELELDPARDHFDGVIVIGVEIREPTDVIWVNADDIGVRSASLAREGGASVALEAAPAVEHFLALRAPATLPAGPATLRIAYTGRIYHDQWDGIYVDEEAGAQYLLTQFEAIDARRAFPCFDEPRHKVPWQLTLRVPRGLEALANTPAAAASVDGEWKTVRFAESKPMPSYLVAFAVGPWEVVDAGKSPGGVPMRIVVPRGRSADAAFAAAETAPILAILEDYFGTPYPYEKIDQIVKPHGGGAMENPGLITYGGPILLIPAGEMSRARQKRFGVVVAHELAHQWFGNLVTCAWWDDLWLNEAFASWMEAKVLARWRPGWPVEAAMVATRADALAADALGTARKIHQPIVEEGDIASAFDAITYDKGGSVLTMVERWLGEERFRDGVRRYLAAHAWGSATYADFVAAIAEVGGAEVRAVFDGLVDRPGAPEVTVAMRCDAGTPPSLHLEQRRYAPLGTTMAAADPWHVPVCVRWGAGKERGGACMVLGAAAADWAFGAPRCPDWLLPNAGGVGYYRSALGGDLGARLAAHLGALTVPERLALVDDLTAQVAAGARPVGELLDLATRLARDADPLVVMAAIDVVDGIHERVPAGRRGEYRALVMRLFGARAKKLGLVAKKGDSDETRELRAALLWLVAARGEDRATIAAATKLALRWLDGGGGVDAELVDTVLAVAARHGDAALWERVRGAAIAAKETHVRRRLLAMLGAFRDPMLVRRSLELVLSGELPAREAIELLYDVADERATAPLALAFVKDHFEELVAVLPRDHAAAFPGVATALCTPEARADVAAWFEGRSTRFVGGQRALAETLELLDMCIAYEQATAPGVAEFLAPKPKTPR
jgi:alanyl aminopeptidase